MSIKIKHNNANKNNHIKKTLIIYKHNKNNNTKISTLRNKVITKIITQLSKTREKKRTTTTQPKK